MAERWCFQCGRAYVAEVEVCTECGVPLVDQQPSSPDDLSAQANTQIAYELHEWSFESRRMVDQILTAQAVVHAWQGASLLVLEHHEAQVDAVIEEVERATLPTLDQNAEHTLYEMVEWSAQHLARLTDRLGLAGIPNQFDGNGDLVVHRADEDEVDRLIDEVTRSLAEGEPEDPIELDGLGTNAILTRAFVCVDKLRRNPGDSRVITEFVDEAGILVRIRTPFGLDSARWGEVVARVRALRDLYVESDDDFDDGEALALAVAIREDLVQLV